MDDPHHDLSTVTVTDEEVRHAIRYLDPDQRPDISDVKRVFAIAIVCDVWLCLIFAAWTWLERSLEVHGRYGR